MGINHKVLILDTTLREGEQTPGVNFSVDDKIQIAKKLSDIGVDMIEAGDPNVSKDLYEAVKRIANEGLSSEILAHVRAVKKDIDKAIECNVDRIAIYFGTSKTHLTYKLKKDKEEAIKIIIQAIEYAREHGFKVRFTAEDASRTDYSFLVRICNAAVNAGADRVSIPDTVGVMTPKRIKDLFIRLRSDVNVELDTHCHNDLGMANSNTLAALEGGATSAHVTINGLGERTGIASISELTVALRVIYNIDTVELSELPSLSLLVEKSSGIVLSPNTPIIGENAFVHKAGVHVAGVLENPMTYEGFPPDLIGRHRDIIIDKYTGIHAVKSRLEKLGISLQKDQIANIVQEIKNSSRLTRFRDADIIELSEKISGQNFSARIPHKIEALILIRCKSNVYTSAIARKIRAIKGVDRIYEISGDYDIEISLNANSTIELNDVLERIREVDGVIATETRLVLRKFE
ncbi:2-isopropylmalate synthase [miscellaneous Crenarchaeota group archaeon SMTZ-80]|nr:MAG: 2-isopropylmalate synthase [miscellaneous Crenarchaeota group archaeon SMTZ-80]